jgi:hypothetical protein
MASDQSLFEHMDEDVHNQDGSVNMSLHTTDVKGRWKATVALHYWLQL